MMCTPLGHFHRIVTRNEGAMKARMNKIITGYFFSLLCAYGSDFSIDPFAVDAAEQPSPANPAAASSLPGKDSNGVREHVIWSPEAAEGRSPLTASPDGRHLAAIVRRGEKMALIVDGKEVSSHEKINWYSDMTLTLGYLTAGTAETIAIKVAVFSQDGRRLAFCASDGGKERVIVDGKEGPPFETVFPPNFSPDGRRFAYTARTKENKTALILDGSVSGIHEEIAEGPIFSPDSQHVAYRACRGKDYFVVLDGRRGKPYGHPGGRHSLTFSPDSKRLVYEAAKGDWRDPTDKPRYFLVDGENEIQATGNIGHIVFSPDSKRLAWADTHLVIDGERVGSFKVNKILFSADGRHIVAAVVQSDRSMLFRDIASLPVEGEWMNWNTLTLSPDGRRVAYASRPNGWRQGTTGEEWLAVIDELKEGTFTNCGSFVFSGDSRRVAFVKKSGEKSAVVVDSIPGEEWQAVSSPLFSGDGKHVFYAALAERTWRILVDGRELVRCDALASPILLDGNDSFHVLCRRGSTFFLVEVRL